MIPSLASAQRAREDDVLITRFLAGEESAFEEIVDFHRAPIFTIALSYLRNAADAEEVTQDTFIRAYRALAQFRRDSSLATWLRRIASNLAKNRYWYFFRRQRHLTLSLDFAVGEDGDCNLGDLFASEEATPAQQSSLNEFSRVAVASIERLEDYHQEILALRNVSQMSYREIAEKLDIKEGTVKSRLARARLRLQELLFSACPDLDPDLDISSWFEPERFCPANQRGWNSRV